MLAATPDLNKSAKIFSPDRNLFVGISETQFKVSRR
ncbi:hypothetical protein EPIR_0675 [Erwinia piriflorinigrans CFBP 5888]|uniref:Uncharacterized protein n=1 Tax=Erwinia piriflorinigrans CFBP 5888 TaxID=1161919 RepID=V5Z405_9GAMM|nr:hypothetical protein EPIR_0675 [Erwinia piriflorinigrans CFBP 5888]